MNFVSGTASTLSATLYEGIAAYRHKVFVETLGWDLKTEAGLEYDQFDRDDTVYVVARDEQDRLSGCARLLPTVRPYLLGDVFPELLHGAPVPCSPDVWELSRFAAVDFNNRTMSPLAQCSAPLSIELLRAAIACAAAHGAKRLVTVSPVGIERLLRRAGIPARRAGPPLIIDGHPIFACWIDVEAINA